jgi:hypothetical protein
MAHAKAEKLAHADPVKVDPKHYTVEVECGRPAVRDDRRGARELVTGCFHGCRRKFGAHLVVMLVLPFSVEDARPQPGGGG